MQSIFVVQIFWLNVQKSDEIILAHYQITNVYSIRLRRGRFRVNCNHKLNGRNNVTVWHFVCALHSVNMTPTAIGIQREVCETMSLLNCSHKTTHAQSHTHSSHSQMPRNKSCELIYLTVFPLVKRMELL